MSWLLSAAMALPALLALLALPLPVRAQTLNRLPTWAVVNFINNSGYGSNEIGIQASDGFVVELSKGNKYVVLPRSQTQAEIRNQGLVEPLDTIGLQRLARGLDADAIATGEVANVRFTSNPRRATVSVVIRVIDRLTGELINGAIAQGTSTPRPIQGNDDDQLVNQAIENADFNAVKSISQFSLPRATVLIHRDADTVTVNKGAQDGLYPGLKMLVTRNGTEVGRIQIANATADESEATVTDRGLGIQPADIATAIYQLPSYSNSPNGFFVDNRNMTPQTAGGTSQAGNAPSVLKGPIGLILAGGLAAAIAGFAHNGGNGGSGLGGGYVGNARAALDANGPALNRIGPDSNASQNLADFVPLSVRVSWSGGNIGGAGQIIETHVYRNPQPTILQVGNFGTLSVVGAEIGHLPAFSPAISPVYDNAQDLASLAILKPSPLDNTLLPLQGIFFGGLATAPQPIPNTALNVGDRVNYSIEELYTIPNLNANNSTGNGTGTTTTGGTGTAGTGTVTAANGSNGNNNTGGLGPLYYQLTSPSDTNYVTYLQPVLFRSSTTGSTLFPITTISSGAPMTADFAAQNQTFAFSTGPSNVQVYVPSVYARADNGGSIPLQYDLQFSTDPQFSANGSVYELTTTGPAGASSNNFRRGLTFQFGGTDANGNSQTIDLTKHFTNPTILYVRLGVRDLRNGTGSDNSYLWSNADSQNVTILPAQLTPGTVAAQGKARPNALASKTVVPNRHVRADATAPGASPAIQTLTPSATMHDMSPHRTQAAPPVVRPTGH